MALAGALEKAILASRTDAELDLNERQLNDAVGIPPSIRPLLADVINQQRAKLREAHDTRQAAEIHEEAAGHEAWAQKAAEIISDIESELDAARRLSDVHRARAMRVRAVQEGNAGRIEKDAADRLALAATDTEKGLEKALKSKPKGK